MVFRLVLSTTWVVAMMTVDVAMSFVVTPPRFSLIQPQSLTSRTVLSVAAEEKKAPRHDVGGDSVAIPDSIRKQMEAFQAHQTAAPKLDFPTDVRTLVQFNHGFAVISTISKADPDYPSGAVVAFAPDEDGQPVFLFSGMSSHTQDILVDPHCALTVAAKGFKGAADGRVTLIGKCNLIRDKEQQEKAKAIYMKKHPGAFWSEFGDFNWFQMQVERVRFVGGFARAGNISAEAYRAAKPDAISEFGPHVAQHMNDDHMQSTIAIVKAMIPGMVATEEGDQVPEITEALITSVDSLGMFVKVTRTGPVAFLPQSFKVRLPFSRQAADRKDVKALIVEMTQQATSEAK